jgi:hypothetical protein
VAYASLSDVVARLGRELSDEESVLVGTRLEDVERMIVRRIPDLEEKVSAGSVVEEDLIQVEAEAVLRLVRNPDGLYMETDGNYSYQFSRESASGRLEIRPEEWRMLGVRPGGVFSLAPSIGGVAL